MLSQKILSDYCQIDNGATVMDVNKEHDRQVKEEGITQDEQYARVQAEMARVKQLFASPDADHDKIIADFKAMADEGIAKAKKREEEAAAQP